MTGGSVHGERWRLGVLFVVNIGDWGFCPW